MNSKLVIIDGDGLCYHSSKETLQESISILDEKMHNIFEKTGATHYVVFISNSPYFRHKIDPLYKSSRGKYTTTLKWLKTLKKYLIEGWGAHSMNEVEADDLCAYWMNNPIPFYDVVLAAVDKDLLKSIIGTHFNYTYKLEDKNDPESVVKGWNVETTLEEAYKFTLYQMVVGDNSDGIKGLEGKGEKFFEKFFFDGMTIPDIFKEYVGLYGMYKGIYEFQKNLRLLHMLDCNEDFLREVGTLPTLPTINEVPVKEVLVDSNDLTF